MKSKIVAIALSGAMSLCAATPVAFTAGESADLANAANWEGGTLPGSDNVAVVDFATLGGISELTLSGDLSASGLILTNMSQSVTLTGEGRTLSLGADGWSVWQNVTNNNYTLTVRANFAVTAAQTWYIANSYVNMYGTMSGTDDLTLRHSRAFVHKVAPAYGGKIIHRFTAGNSFNAQYALEQKGVWANDLQGIDAGGRIELRFTGPATWQEIFPGRSITSDSMFLLTQYGTPNVSFNDGDSYKCTTTSLFVTDTGSFTQNGGTMETSVQVGYSTYPSFYEMRGGTLSTHQLVIGNGTSTEWTTNQAFRMIGGTVNADYLELGWRGATPSFAHSDMSVNGGTITLKDSTDLNSGLHFAANYNDAASSVQNKGIACGYRQTGGTVKTPKVTLGTPKTISSWEYVSPMSDCWVTMAVNGGLLDVGAGGFYAAKTYWNKPPLNNPSASVNSRYRMSFKEGTLAAYAPFTSELDFAFTANSTPFAIDTREHDVTLAAPIWGSGDVEKKGTGTLIVADGSRHTGRIAVKEGTLKVVGCPSEDETIDGARCFAWRAEEAVAGLEDKAEITNWPDASGERTAIYDGINKNGVAVTKPTVEMNAFNGRPGVNFNRSALKIAAADNPFGGSTNWTLCVVLKTTSPGIGNGGNWYAARGIVGREVGGTQNDWGLVFDQNGHFGAGLGINPPVNDSCLYSQKANCADGVPHVVFYSLDCTGKRTLVVDGEVQSDMKNLNATDKSPRRKDDIYLGVQNIADSEPYYYAFIGTVAEFRFYPDNALTAAERASVGGTLAAKYGASLDVYSTSGNDAPKGEITASVVDAPMPDDGAAAWDAESLDSLEDGAAVESWPSVDGTRVANIATGRLRTTSSSDLSTAVTSTVQPPVLRKGAINGRNALVFNGSQALGIPAADSPVSGKEAWTVAMVFRTTEERHPGNSAQFYLGNGLFGAELPNSYRADWGVTFWANQGRILAGYGGKNASNKDQNAISRAWDLNDGEPHALVATFDTTTGIVKILVDGVGLDYAVTKCSSLTTRDAVRVLIGSINCDYFFKGEIAAFRLYDRVITDAESDALLAGWNDRYAIPPASKDTHVTGDSGRLGLGAKEITVASGATLALPVAQMSPFTLKGAQRMTVAGSVRGTIGVGRGGVLDLSDDMPQSLDGLWMKDGGIVRASFHQESPIALSGFRAEGTPVIEMTDAPSQLPGKFTLFTYAGEAALADGTDWIVRGASASSKIVIEDGKVTLRSLTGTAIIIK